MLLCIQPTFKIVTVACLSSPPCSDCIRFYKSSLLTPAIRDRFFKRLQPKSCRTSKSKSSNALIRPKGLSFCRDVGWSNALSLGSTVAAGWPRISRTSTETPSLFSASPRFASCSEGFVRVHKLFGRTLRESCGFPALVFVKSPQSATALAEGLVHAGLDLGTEWSGNLSQWI